MLKVVLVDDENHCLAALQEKIKFADEQIQVAACCNTAKEAIEIIDAIKPDAVFLDISMPQMDGFRMLEELETIDFELIFTTAHNEYAIKAIRMSAFDFLLKPVSMDELKDCLQRLHGKMKHKRMQLEREKQVNNIVQLLRNPAATDAKLTLPTQAGLMFIPIKDIIRVQAESNYTNFFLANGKKEMVSKTMKDFEDILCTYNFFRVHKSHIVNLGAVKNYIKGDGGRLLLNDGSEVEVSVRKKAELLERLLFNH